MNRTLEKLKEYTERSLGVRIFRHSIPHGTDLVMDLERRIGPTDFSTIFDVGANVGQTALAFAEQFPAAEIYSFEPVPNTFATLEANTRHCARVRAFNVAFGSARACLPMAIKADSRTSSFAIEEHGGEEETMAHTMVNIVTIDDFAAEHNVTKIDFLKIDTEGFDLEVLHGADGLIRAGGVDLIQVETGFDPATVHVGLGQFLEHLQERNFALFGIYEQQPFWTGEPWLMFANAVFIRRDILASKRSQ
jgi:FkbM family methyltransferase